MEFDYLFTKITKKGLVQLGKDETINSRILEERLQKFTCNYFLVKTTDSELIILPLFTKNSQWKKEATVLYTKEELWDYFQCGVAGSADEINFDDSEELPGVPKKE